jgi:1,4-alpha-glucan branching enzyme
MGASMRLGRGTSAPDDLMRSVAVIKKQAIKGSDQVKVSFILPADAVDGRVSVVGDFNGWNPAAHPLRPRSNGTRSAAVTLPSGHRFAFRYLAEGDRWYDDDSAHEFAPNGIGGVNSVVHT